MIQMTSGSNRQVMKVTHLHCIRLVADRKTFQLQGRGYKRGKRRGSTTLYYTGAAGSRRRGAEYGFHVALQALLQGNGGVALSIANPRASCIGRAGVDGR